MHLPKFCDSGRHSPVENILLNPTPYLQSPLRVLCMTPKQYLLVDMHAPCSAWPHSYPSCATEFKWSVQWHQLFNWHTIHGETFILQNQSKWSTSGWKLNSSSLQHWSCSQHPKLTASLDKQCHRSCTSKWATPSSMQWNATAKAPGPTQKQVTQPLCPNFTCHTTNPAKISGCQIHSRASRKPGLVRRNR